MESSLAVMQYYERAQEIKKASDTVTGTRNLLILITYGKVGKMF